MSEDSKAMFQSKNFTLPDGWVLNEPQRSFNGGFGTAGIKKIIDHTRKMFQNVPGMISILGLVHECQPLKISRGFLIVLAFKYF